MEFYLLIFMMALILLHVFHSDKEFSKKYDERTYELKRLVDIKESQLKLRSQSRLIADEVTRHKDFGKGIGALIKTNQPSDILSNRKI